ncbi:hypothetical protein STEG23_024267, partial [Scotinomys teguina]
LFFWNEQSRKEALHISPKFPTQPPISSEQKNLTIPTLTTSERTALDGELTCEKLLRRKKTVLGSEWRGGFALRYCGQTAPFPADLHSMSSSK